MTQKYLDEAISNAFFERMLALRENNVSAE